MQKVCHVTSVHPRFDVRIFLKECVALARVGYDVTLLCADNLPDEIKEGVTIKSVDYFPSGRIKRILGAKKAMLKSTLEIDADLYHLHDPELLPVALQLKRMGKIVVFDSHEDVPRQILNKPWIPKLLRKTISWIFEKYEKSSAKKIDHIITATPYIESIFRESTDRVTTICNFPRISEFEDLPDFRNESGFICYIGGITQDRGIIQLIKAIEIAKTELHLCGDFESVKLKQEITALPGFKYAKYHGYLNRIDIIKILSESSIGIVTLLPTQNHLNSYPIKMFEYMAAGIPVIASNFPLWMEVIEGNHCGICVNPKNVVEIANAIASLTENPQLSSLMGIHGRKVVFEKYNWENEEKKLLHLYAELLKSIS